MPKSFENQFSHLARCITLKIGPSVQECWGTVISSLFSFLPFYLKACTRKSRVAQHESKQHNG